MNYLMNEMTAIKYLQAMNILNKWRAFKNKRIGNKHLLIKARMAARIESLNK